MKNLLAMTGFAMSLAVAQASAQEAPTPPPVLFGFPTPNGGAIVGGQYGGTGGVVTHQPLGGGYTSNGANIGTPGGTSFGGNVITDPSNKPIGGGITFSTTF